MRLCWRYRVAWNDAHLVKVPEHPENPSDRMSWARSTLAIRWKAFKTRPPELCHLRPRILVAMLKVVNKAAEKYVRHRRLWPIRERLGYRKSARRIPAAARSWHAVHCRKKVVAAVAGRKGNDWHDNRLAVR
jgi:hypothetical protein